MNRGKYTTEIYDLLYYCEQYKSGKKVLDCGAGGAYPKLALFADKSYELFGIDSSIESLQKAYNFAKENQIEINLKKADIREIPFPDASFDVVYSYNTIFHLRKRGIKKAIDEIIRVLKPKGIGYINFLDVKDVIHKTDKEDAPGEFINPSNGYDAIHTLLTTNECEAMLNKVKILERQRKYINNISSNYKETFGYLDYYFQK
ncbi:MAG: class I SAM-dependent methyltransferase [Candidatus Lokiarchaeota archaeon]